VDKITPRRKPCASCPYRRGVPSGIWAAEEYDKLTAYDGETFEQPPGVFMCHQADEVCSGWATVHGTPDSLSLRLAHSQGEDVTEVLAYSSPVPCFSSGAEAAEHGKREIEDLSEEAENAVVKIAAVRERQGKPVSYD
jgi:hypothetical protein